MIDVVQGGGNSVEYEKYALGDRRPAVIRFQAEAGGPRLHMQRKRGQMGA
jgi:hypothetical protein